jgi:NAD-dependent dihydropyrimidine dehydrogenase PreA subunit
MQMQGLRYIEDAVTLQLDAERCTGCGLCVDVCPQAVFSLSGRRAELVDRGACMECGACALNCVAGAITLTPGVGCAAAIMRGWITGSEPSCDCGGAC